MDDLNDLVWSSAPSNGNASKLQPPSVASSTSRTSSPSAFDFLANSNGANRNYYGSSPAPTASGSTNTKTQSSTAAAGMSSDAFSSLLSFSSTPSGSLSMQEKAKMLAEEQQRKKEEDANRWNWDSLGSSSNPASSSTVQKQLPNREFDGLLSFDSKPLAPSSKPTTPVPSLSSVPRAAQQQTSSFDFDDLLTSTPAQTQKKFSLQEKTRQLAAEQAKKVKEEDNSWGDLLNGLGSTSISNKPKPPPTDSIITVASESLGWDSLVDHPVPPQAQKIRPTSPAASALAQPSSNVSKAKNALIWDDDDGADGDEEVGGLLGIDGRNERDEFDFDFGDREDRETSTRTPSVNSSAPSRPSSSVGSRSIQKRSYSPPPHILGQIVMMGFSPAQAKRALASTEGGLDVQRAVEILLSEQRDGASPGPAIGAEERVEDQQAAEEAAAAERRRKRRAGPSRSAINARGNNSDSQPASGSITPQLPINIQEQADKLMVQADQLRASVFSKATSLWSQGKKAYEERLAATGATTPRENDGRPKWMLSQGAADDDEFSEHRGEVTGGGFKDSDDEGEVRAPQPRRHQQNGLAPSSPARSPREEVPPQQRPKSSATESRDLLFSDGPGPVRSSSPAPKLPASRTSTPALRSPLPSTSSYPSRPPPPRKVEPLVKRDIISASASAIQKSIAHRTKGNEVFKLGQFSEAELAYSGAIDCLPKGCLNTIPPLNNRATTRLKTGEYRGTITDATEVIRIIGLAYNPSKEESLPEEYSEINLGEALVKAVSKRASAYEMSERWVSAKTDWEAVGKLEFSVKTADKIAALDGLRRCKKMIDGPSKAPPPPKAKLVSTKPAAPSEAVNRLKAANATQESEDNLRSSLKDSVDFKMKNWSAGKETNLRALIASLDTVLWPELGWTKVGLHELVTDKQVKIKYTRAISKVHPDKIGVSGVSVENRMIAGGVFGILNEAWSASQP